MNIDDVPNSWSRSTASGDELEVTLDVAQDSSRDGWRVEARGGYEDYRGDVTDFDSALAKFEHWCETLDSFADAKDEEDA